MQITNGRDQALSLVGGVAGGAVGVLAFGFLLRQGFYALVLPGAFLGLGVYALSRGRSSARGIVAGLAALLLGLLAEWWFRPFVADPSLIGFVKRVPSLTPVTLLMLGLGTAFGFWWGRDARLSTIRETSSN